MVCRAHSLMNLLFDLLVRKGKNCLLVQNGSRGILCDLLVHKGKTACLSAVFPTSTLYVDENISLIHYLFYIKSQKYEANKTFLGDACTEGKY